VTVVRSGRGMDKDSIPVDSASTGSSRPHDDDPENRSP
jgi:hypothetical protein